METGHATERKKGDLRDTITRQTKEEIYIL